MADNPHELEKKIRGQSTLSLTGKGEDNVVDKIAFLKDDYATGNSQNLHAIEKAIKQYNKTISNRLGNESFTGVFKTDEVDAGFLPLNITKFLDRGDNPALFDFFSNTDKLFGLRKINPDYTGFGIRVQRRFDLREVDIKFNSAGQIASDSEIVEFFAGFNSNTETLSATNLGEFSDLSNQGSNATDNKFSNDLRVTKWYSQGDSSIFTGNPGYSSNPNGTTVDGVVPFQFGNNAISGERIGLSFSDASSSANTYAGFAKTDDDGGLHDWALFSGVTISNQEYPVYALTAGGGFSYSALFPHDFGSNSPYGVRWVFTNATRMAGSQRNPLHQIQSLQQNALSDSTPLVYGYSNTLADAKDNRPTGHTSWSIKEGGSVSSNFDTSVTAIWTQPSPSKAPTLGTGGTLHTVDGLPTMKFKEDGNAGMLQSVGNTSSEGKTLGIVCSVDEPQNATEKAAMAHGGGISQGNGPFVVHGAISVQTAVNSYQMSFKGSPPNPIQFSSGMLTEGTYKDHEGFNSALPQVILFHDSKTAGSSDSRYGTTSALQIGSKGSGLQIISSSNVTSSLALNGANNDSAPTNLGATSNMSDPWDGGIQEFFVLNSLREETDEQKRYTGDMGEYYSI